MKVYINKQGALTAIAQTVEDAKVLLGLMNELKEKPSRKMACPVCSLLFYRGRGIARHISSAHKDEVRTV